MWGNHCEYIFSNRHYGNGGRNGSFLTGGFTAGLQGTDWQNVPGLNANLNAIENHNPSPNIDVHWWIPQGLPYDLIDDRNDEAFGGLVIDNVAGYTTQECFNALLSDVRTVPAFRNKLLQQNGNDQIVNVNDLFFGNGY